MLFLLCALIVTFFQSCRKVYGEGPVVTRNYMNSGFSGVYSSFDADIYIKQENRYSVEISAQQNILDEMDIFVSGGTLNLELKRNVNLGRHDRIVVYISMPNVYSLGVNGSGNMKSLYPITTTDISLKVNGSGNLTLPELMCNSANATISGSGTLRVNGGYTNSLYTQISGSGEIDFLNFNTKTCTASISGSGNTKVNVSDLLNATISGSGNIYYLGNPSVNANISGSGRVSKY